MSQHIVMLGFILIIAGIAAVIIGSAGAKEAKTGFGGVIGPFVIGFGNDRN